MSDDSWQADVTKMTRILQIVVGALVAGTLFFLVIALTIGPQGVPSAAPLPISLTLIAALFTGMMLIARAVCIWQVTARGRRQIAGGTYRPVSPQQWSGAAGKPVGDAQSLFMVFQTRTIASAAMFEGCAFFATICYLIEGGPISLALAVCLILGVAAHFPTPARVIGWIERQLETLEEERRPR
ncbi:MAG: hypothetical protein ABSF26_04160 [Thermoguttaceae bacterium]|jgi:uncharacterized membrane protein YbhN (UPF0104 family)